LRCDDKENGENGCDNSQAAQRYNVTRGVINKQATIYLILHRTSRGPDLPAHPGL
jgi:hypothetical protein